MMPVIIGTRDDLTEQAAQTCGEMWRTAVKRYPKALFVIQMPGYDHDPRELWEIPEVTHYVRRWAYYAGMDDIIVADRYLGASSAIGQPATAGFGFLAACGVFGDARLQKPHVSAAMRTAGR
jgi:hypothetical protein